VSGVIAVLGFGEAGTLLAGDLVAAGATVRGYDPKVPAPARAGRRHPGRQHARLAERTPG
jgi:3-hydroxyisobutyrate dehydrogenase-like beta-hydroxyacid dehydrogenase